MRDYKEVYAEAYYDALESGMSKEEAENLANDMLEHYSSSLLDEADLLRKYGE